MTFGTLMLIELRMYPDFTCGVNVEEIKFATLKELEPFFWDMHSLNMLQIHSLKILVTLKHQ